MCLGYVNTQSRYANNTKGLRLQNGMSHDNEFRLKINISRTLKWKKSLQRIPFCFEEVEKLLHGCSLGHWRTLSWISFLFVSWTNRRLWKTKHDPVPVILNLYPHFKASVGSPSCQFKGFIGIGLKTEPPFLMDYHWLYCSQEIKAWFYI